MSNAPAESDPSHDLFEGDGPLFSVVVPVWNGAATLGAALRSIQAQSEQRFEVIVVDDASTDASLNIIEKVAVPHRLIRHSTNLGVAAARNTGLAAARAPLVAFLDQDDLWDNGHLRTLRDALRSVPDAVLAAGRERTFATTDIRPILESDRPDLARWVDTWVDADQSETLIRLDEGISPAFEVIDAATLAASPIVTTASFAIRRDVARRCGGFSPLLTSVDDYVLQVLAAREGSVVRCTPSTCLYRIHVSATSFSRRNTRSYLAANVAIRYGRAVPVPVSGLREQPQLVAAFYDVVGERPRRGRWAEYVAFGLLLSSGRTDRSRLARIAFSESLPLSVRRAGRRAKRVVGKFLPASP